MLIHKGKVTRPFHLQIDNKEGSGFIMVPLVLVDGHNLLWRAAFGFPARIKSRRGIDRTAIFGFFALVRAATKHVGEAAEWIICFDGQYGIKARLMEDDSYKGQRLVDNNSHLEALPHIKAGLDLMNIRWVELEESEADDLIATLTSREIGRQVYVMSTDKDYYQLVGDSVYILNTAMKGDQRILHSSDIFHRYGITPEQWCDFRALTGDPADNISGVPGIGPRTAARLLANGAFLEDIVSDGLLSSRTCITVQSCWEKLLRDRQLLRMREVLDLPILTTGNPTSNWLTPAQVLGALDLW